MCGIVGVWVKDTAAKKSLAAESAAFALRRLQHRGREGAGLVVYDESIGQFRKRHGVGLISDILTGPHVATLVGRSAIAQNRYSTAGQKKDPNPVRNIGPLCADTWFGDVAVGHNGNLKGATALRETLKREGAIFQTGTDTEVLLHFLARSREPTFVERLRAALHQIPIAYSFVVLRPEELYAVRDPLGIRPLLIGESDELIAVASENIALQAIGIMQWQEVKAGEMVCISDAGIRSIRFAPAVEERPCIFEYHYFSRPDSEGVAQSRQLAGRLLARNHPVPRHEHAPVIVIGVPDSGLHAANGYAKEAGLPLELALVRDHVEGRVFMQPTDGERELSAMLKHAAIRRIVEGAVVIVIDDSIVRGNTFRRIITLIRAAGALEVHGRIATPPILHPCFYGLDTPTFGELLAHRLGTLEAMALELNLDTLDFVSLCELEEATAAATGKQRFCSTCFDKKILHGQDHFTVAA